MRQVAWKHIWSHADRPQAATCTSGFTTARSSVLPADLKNVMTAKFWICWGLLFYTFYCVAKCSTETCYLHCLRTKHKIKQTYNRPMKHIVTIKLLKTDSNMLNQSTKGIFIGNLGTGTVALGSGDGVGMGMGIITTGTVGDGDKSCPRAALYRIRGTTCMCYGRVHCDLL